MRLARFYTWLQRRVDAAWMLPVHLYYRWHYRKPRWGKPSLPNRWCINWYNHRPRVCLFVKCEPMFAQSMTGTLDWLHTPDGFFMVPACALQHGGQVEPDCPVRFA